jgi:SAM-dependent methyltransferase
MAVDTIPISPSEPLEPTGERYTSAAKEEVKHEHYHRYLFALQFCDKKEVLDVGSHEGYGSALLGMVAQQVFGVDLSPEAVARASRNYCGARVSFTVGAYAAVPFPDASVDVVVSFDTLEHVADREKFFCEIKRILRPDGMLVISTPNAKVNKDPAIGLNPSQVRELDADEFHAILSEHFSNYRLFGQLPINGSAIAPDSSLLSDRDRHQTFRAADSGVYSVQEGIGPPTYFIAVASETALPEIRHGLLDDRPFLRNLYDLLEKRAIAIREIEQRLRASVTDRDALQNKLRSRESELSEVHARLSQLSRELQSRDDELARSRALVAQIYGSASWRITLPLRFLRQIAEAIRRRSALLAERLGVGGLLGRPVFSYGTNSKAREARLPLPLEADKRLHATPPQAASTEPESEMQVLQRSGLFDEQFYCEANPDVGTGVISPLEHYLSVGGFEGRRPNRLFDSAYYLGTYSDVAKAGVNPALHYFQYGALQGRDPSAEFDTSFYLETNPDVVTGEINPLVHFLRFGAQEGRFPRLECYEQDLQKLGRLAAARNRQDKLDYRLLVSVLMGTYNTEPIYLQAAVRSVMAQAYSNWELRIVDDGSSNPATLDALGRVAAWDERIFVIRNAHHGGISDARNCALHDARGEYVAMLGHDDELTFDALYEVVVALNTDRTTDVVYTDQWYVSPGGEPTIYLFKPDWSPFLFRGVMYVGHLLIVRRSQALDVGGFESAFDGIQDFEFMLRISERTRKIRHVPKVLYRCRQISESVANGGKANGGVDQLQAAAVQAHLGRLGLDGLARPHPQHPRRIIIQPVRRPPNTTFDLIVHCGAIPMADAWAINRALARTAHRPVRIAVPAAWSGIEIAANTTIDLLFDHAGRHFSDAERLTQFLAESRAEFVLAMSADVAIETDGWMELLTVAMQECEVAVACPAVLSADGLIAHAGLIVGSDAGVRPAMRGLEPQSDGYAGSLSCAREISAAWADVVLLRRSAIASLLPSKKVYITADFLVADLTLRATSAGLRALCVPYVRARQTVRTESDEARRLDALLFQDIWAGKAVVDPFYNPSFVETRADDT